MGTLIQDLRYGLRMLARNPGFTAVAIITLALGIGANAAIFSVVNAVLLRPLPFLAPDQLVRVESIRLPANAPDNASYPDFLDWRARNHVFEGMAVFRTNNFTLLGRAEAANVQGAVVSADLFRILGVRPSLGRAFLPEEDKPGAADGGDAVTLSHRLWRQRFGADRNIVGRTINLDSRSFTVIGVMPPGFQFPIQAEPIDLWTTIAVDIGGPNGGRGMADQRGAHYLDVIARLKPSVSVAEADAEINTIFSALGKQHPNDSAHRGARIVPERDQLVGDVRPALLILLGAVGCVLLIACANVANLLLARATTRQKEVAVRSALGASRGRVFRQLLTESVALSVLGSTAGLFLAVWGTNFLLRLIPEDVPRLTEVHLDGQVLAFTVVLSLLTGLLFGLAPAVQASKTTLTESLKEGGRGATEGLHRNRVRSILAVTEVAAALVLLVGAGLLAQSFLRLEHVDPGFDPHHVLTFALTLPDARYSGARQVDFFQQVVAHVGRLPGVRSASAGGPLPLSRDEIDARFDIEGRSVPVSERPRTGYTWVEPGYFRTLGIPLLKGRDFAAADNLKSRPVLIINEALARRFFPNEDPIGKRIEPGIGNGYPKGPPMREIVAVVGDIKQNSLEAPSSPNVYVPLAQSPLDFMTFVVRTDVTPESIVGSVRNQIREMDKDLPMGSVKTLDQYLSQFVAQSQFNTLLVGLFAALALLLAAVGLYGVISYTVSQRTHELGIRMALGAERRDVLRLIVAQAFVLTLIGVCIGLLAAVALTRFLATLLYGVRPTDPVTFFGVSLLLGGVSLFASYIPARRAAKVDPMVALRYE